MVNYTIVLPCAVLGGICAGMLIFIWWWFPRTWKKGSKEEEETIDMSIQSAAGGGDGLTREEKRRMAGQRAREYLQAVEARNKARAEGRDEWANEPLPVYEGTVGSGGPNRTGPPTYTA